MNKRVFGRDSFWLASFRELSIPLADSTSVFVCSRPQHPRGNTTPSHALLEPIINYFLIIIFREKKTIIILLIAARSKASGQRI